MKKILGITLLMLLIVFPAFNAQNTNNSAREQIVAPEANIEAVRVLEDGSVKVRYNLYDPSNMLISNDKYKPEVRLYKGEDLVKRKDAIVGEDQYARFANIEDETTYTVVIRGAYDMYGTGQPTNANPYELAKTEVSVPKIKAIPTANIHLTTDENPTVLGEDSLDVHYDIVDIDSALINEGPVGPRILVQEVTEENPIYYGIPTVGLNEVENVTGLESGHTYRVSITGQYDVNQDGKVDNDSPYVLASKEFTLGQIVPEGYIGVGTCKDLESIGQGANYPGATHTEAWSLDGNYALTNDIDCSTTNPSNVNHDTTESTTYGEDGFEPIGTSSTYFTGNFDGQNYKIDGLYTYRPSTYNVGLFGCVEGADIENVGIVNAYVRGSVNTAGLVGFQRNTAIKDSYVTGQIVGLHEVAGLIGDSWNSQVENSFVLSEQSGKMQVGGLIGESHYTSINNTYAISRVKGDTNVGGLIGDNSQGEIKNSYTIADVEGNNNVGGLVGVSFGHLNLTGTEVIENSYAIADVEGNNSVGGLVGYNGGGAKIVNSYTTSSVKGDTLVGGLVGYNKDPEEDIITNSYRIENQVISGEDVNSLGEVVTLDELLNPNWYTDVLGFDANWNVALVSEGYYPHVMKTDLSEEVTGQENVAIV